MCEHRTAAQAPGCRAISTSAQLVWAQTKPLPSGLSPKRFLNPFAKPLIVTPAQAHPRNLVLASTHSDICSRAKSRARVLRSPHQVLPRPAKGAAKQHQGRRRTPTRKTGAAPGSPHSKQKTPSSIPPFNEDSPPALVTNVPPPARFGKTKSNRFRPTVSRRAISTPPNSSGPRSKPLPRAFPKTLPEPLCKAVHSRNPSRLLRKLVRQQAPHLVLRSSTRAEDEPHPKNRRGARFTPQQAEDSFAIRLSMKFTPLS